ncbi:MAG: flagellar biosynthetic protein FliO [bacterium]
MLWLSIVKMIAVLLGVLGLILLLAYLARRLGLSRYRGRHDGNGVEILGTRSLGPRRQVVILRVGDSILLVGATDRNLTPLMEIRDPEEREKILKGFEKTLPPSFRGILRKFESS